MQTRATNKLKKDENKMIEDFKTLFLLGLAETRLKDHFITA